MNNKVKFIAMLAAAMAAETHRHYDASGFGINRQEWRRRYGKSKGGRKGVGMINGLPKSSKYIAKPAPRRQCGNRNLAAWERAAWA